ncbi:hypothetical protein [Chryseobacterium profundimaris]|uniref:Lipoprotein n=1 Tax=Chryseobacterium profundimaris TaxID=1387275 RepID=A0ABY1NYZ0_9FLAO|nr:hypothetical protein [Chryseobacterium profundimaris]SMP19582.1 hypothetical protein SAMN06264346_105149 [Chryseobacterium profundimaris]
MKKGLFAAAAIIALSFTACKKSESGNKSVLKSDNTAQTVNDSITDPNLQYETDVNGKKYIKTDFVYKATDGSLAKVVFDYKEKTMSIRSNNKTFILNKVDSKGNESVYEKMDMKATVKGDSLILDQGSNIIELVKTKI